MDCNQFSPIKNVKIGSTGGLRGHFNTFFPLLTESCSVMLYTITSAVRVLDVPTQVPRYRDIRARNVHRAKNE